ncbi:MAG: hypothetical protein ACT4OU_11940 [Hyphomicrobium sp.]
MKLSEARFVSIVGTEVLATPTSAGDAKLALKELRQKKKEFGLRRRALLAQHKTAKAAAERAEGGSARQKQSGLVAALGRLVGRARAAKPKRDAAEIEADIAEVDEILFNIDSCAVQIEGKLLNMG